MKSFSKFAMLIATLILCGLLFFYLNNLQSSFREVTDGYKGVNPSVINLSKNIDSKKLAKILYSNGYVANIDDAEFIADTLAKRLKEERLSFPNLYHLQKRKYGKVSAVEAENAHVLWKKLNDSHEALGFVKAMPSVEDVKTRIDFKNDSSAVIVAKINEEKEISRGKVLDKFIGKKKELVCQPNVLVRLISYQLVGDEVQRDTAFAKTDSMGCAYFCGLNRVNGYSVLPIRKGFEYGSTKGVRQGKFEEFKWFHRFGKKDYTFRFVQLEHRIQMIDNATLKQIKNDGAITVRTPDDFRTEVIKWFVLLVIAWWALALWLKRRKKYFDPVLLASVMFLSVFCVIIMFSIQNPLTEELRGVEMATGVLIGIGLIAMFQFVDFVKLYQGDYKFGFDIPLSIFNWLFLPFKQKVSWLHPILIGDYTWYKKFGALLLLLLCVPFLLFSGAHWLLSKFKQWTSRLLLQQGHVFQKALVLLLLLFGFPFLLLMRLFERIPSWLSKLPKGFGWLIFAILLTALLWTPLGREIGGMKVNLSLLGLTFQPSEIAKYLILFFMAAFFTQNADNIIAYSQPNRTKIWSKVKTLGWLILGILLLMAIYAALGDMGPGLVIGITFVLLYSIVKSKVNLDNLTEEDKWERIFTCDFAMMIYGVLSFALIILIGFGIAGGKIALLFAVLWFIAWIFFGLSYHRQFFETAVVLNLLIFMFVFGGQILQGIPALEGTDTVERFAQRTSMCVNTWGDLKLDESHDKRAPVENTQIVNGLWAIATGGIYGRGLGEGNPNLIPAFHTDMILSSIGEQLGWIGLFFVVVVLALLLRRIVVVGYRVGHPFAFYICLGIATVTAVQFFVIALGSSGMIPLTGITVPFLSYGRVSMVLNLMALGVALSLSKNISQDDQSTMQTTVRQRSVGDYNYPISIVTLAYITLAIFTLAVWQYYAFWDRGNTLVKSVFVKFKGTNKVEYNPRIALLTREMMAGNIYDRKGFLLATSDPHKLDNDEDSDCKKLREIFERDSLNQMAKVHQKRYYPFGDHLLFMLGNVNTGFISYNERSPLGYMAEGQHLAYLRGFDNTFKDNNGNKIGELICDGERMEAYIDKKIPKKDTIRALYDYKDLKKYLKSGINGRHLKKHNQKVADGEFDLHMTIDAGLQCNLQDSISAYAQRKFVNNNLLRISVVVLDANNGDLLASANFPTPNYHRLVYEEEAALNRGKKYAVYNDYYKKDSPEWKAYSNCDLGLINPTAPGSTAKVMSAMAGLQKDEIQKERQCENQRYLVLREEIVEEGSSPEPYKGRSYIRKKVFTVDKVDMRLAIVESSNCYFINLVNDHDLYWNLDSIYEAVGIQLAGIMPYHISDKMDVDKRKKYRKEISATEKEAESKYATYKESRENGAYREMSDGCWQWAWGQGNLAATPVSMARVVSTIVNRGVMPYTNYTMEDKHNEYVQHLRNEGGIRLLSEANAALLANMMREETANQKYRQGKDAKLSFPEYMGGKTGTPERDYALSKRQIYNSKKKKTETVYHWQKPKFNDGWYMFFIDEQEGKRPLAVCVRMERTQSSGSGAAVRLTSDVVLPILGENDYIDIK